jgi:hypothetical protein
MQSAVNRGREEQPRIDYRIDPTAPSWRPKIKANLKPTIFVRERKRIDTRVSLRNAALAQTY